jgi:hypothetical protein
MMLRLGARVRTAAVIERLPKMAPKLAPWEVKWEIALRNNVLWKLGKAPDFVKKDLHHFVTTEFLDAFYDGETTTTDDKNKNLKSANRALDQTLFLLLKQKSGEWGFPTVDCLAKESLRDAAERGVKEYFNESLQVYFTGIAPLAHYEAEGEKLENEDQKEKVCFLIQSPP